MHGGVGWASRGSEATDARLPFAGGFIIYFSRTHAPARTANCVAFRELVPGNLGQLSWVFIEDRDPDFESQYPRALEQDEARWDELAADNVR